MILLQDPYHSISDMHCDSIQVYACATGITTGNIYFGIVTCAGCHR